MRVSIGTTSLRIFQNDQAMIAKVHAIARGAAMTTLSP